GWVMPYSGLTSCWGPRYFRTYGSIHHHDRDHRSRCLYVPRSVVGMSVSTIASATATTWPRRSARSASQRSSPVPHSTAYPARWSYRRLLRYSASAPDVVSRAPSSDRDARIITHDVPMSMSAARLTQLSSWLRM